MFIHFLLAMLPIIWLIIALSGLKMAGHVACPIALIGSQPLKHFFVEAEDY